MVFPPNKKIGVIACCLLFFALPFSLIDASVIVNEICWMGSAASANDEWIELYNPGQENVKLDGWVLKTADDGIKINLKGEVPAMGFFLLERTNDDSAPSAKADLIYRGALSNEGEDLKLIDGNNNVIDEVNCADGLALSEPKGWFAGDNKTKQTMERTENGLWQTSQSPEGTPKETNSIKQIVNNETLIDPQKTAPEPASQPTLSQTETVTNRSDRYGLSQAENVLINEIMPSPEGSDTENEWVEIFNANNFEADLTSWKIRDKIGAVKTYTFPENTKIEANGFLILKRPQTKISLNNESDGLEILSPSGKIIDSVDFEKAKQGQSWSKTGGIWPAESPSGNQAGWQWTVKPTPGQTNIIVAIQAIAASNSYMAASAATSTQGKQLLANIQNYPPQRKNFLAITIAILIAAGSAIIAWQIKKKSIEI